jgi:hypothetical protein
MELAGRRGPRRCLLVEHLGARPRACDDDGKAERVAGRVLRRDGGEHREGPDEGPGGRLGTDQAPRRHKPRAGRQAAALLRRAHRRGDRAPRRSHARLDGAGRCSASSCPRRRSRPSITIHLFKEAYCRETGEWLGPEPRTKRRPTNSRSPRDARHGDHRARSRTDRSRRRRRHQPPRDHRDRGAPGPPAATRALRNGTGGDHRLPRTRLRRSAAPKRRAATGARPDLRSDA